MSDIVINLTDEEQQELDRARGRYSAKAFLMLCVRAKNRRKEKIAKEVDALPPAVRDKMKELWAIWKAVYQETHGEQYIVEESVNGKRPQDITLLEKYARMNPTKEEAEKRMIRYCLDQNKFFVSNGHRFRFFQWNAYSDGLQKRKNGEYVAPKKVSALRLQGGA
jgi:hypothetical protein